MSLLFAAGAFGAYVVGRSWLDSRQAQAQVSSGEAAETKPASTGLISIAPLTSPTIWTPLLKKADEGKTGIAPKIPEVKAWLGGAPLTMNTAQYLDSHGLAIRESFWDDAGRMQW